MADAVMNHATVWRMQRQDRKRCYQHVVGRYTIYEETNNELKKMTAEMNTQISNHEIESKKKKYKVTKIKSGKTRYNYVVKFVG